MLATLKRSALLPQTRLQGHHRALRYPSYPRYSEFIPLGVVCNMIGWLELGLVDVPAAPRDA